MLGVLKHAVIAMMLATSAYAIADANSAPRTVDLRSAHALERLRETNPSHFETLERVIEGLLEQPTRAEGDWLEVNFDARDVNLTRHLMWTSNPPKQLLQFTLDEVRYIMHVTRADLIPSVKPAS